MTEEKSTFRDSLRSAESKRQIDYLDREAAGLPPLLSPDDKAASSDDLPSPASLEQQVSTERLGRVVEQPPSLLSEGVPPATPPVAPLVDALPPPSLHQQGKSSPPPYMRLLLAAVVAAVLLIVVVSTSHQPSSPSTSGQTSTPQINPSTSGSGQTSAQGSPSSGNPGPRGATEQVRNVLIAYIKASYSGNGQAICSLMTPSFQRFLANKQGDSTCSEAMTPAGDSPSYLQRFSEGKFITAVRRSSILIHGDSATISDATSGAMNQPYAFSAGLQSINGQWLVNSLNSIVL